MCRLSPPQGKRREDLLLQCLDRLHSYISPHAKCLDPILLDFLQLARLADLNKQCQRPPNRQSIYPIHALRCFPAPKDGKERRKGENDIQMDPLPSQAETVLSQAAKSKRIRCSLRCLGSFPRPRRRLRSCTPARREGARRKST